MGRELSGYVEGNAVSRHLICSICHGVLESPVQTRCEHLFCEEELIEWLSHGTAQTCPVCAAAIDPEEVARAPRAIVGLIADLVCYCDFATAGCPWTGAADALAAHARGCDYAPREHLVALCARQARDLDAGRRDLAAARASLADRDRDVARLRRRVEQLEKALGATEELHERELEREVGRVHDRYRAPADARGPRRRRSPRGAAGADRSDVARINSLRDSLETLRLHPADDNDRGRPD